MNLNWSSVFLPLGFIALALVLFWLSGRIKRNAGMPDGTIIYADPGKWGKPEKPLYDAELGLTGKPDYLIRKEKWIIPVEVKSTWAPSIPYDSHKLQLAAYCLLVRMYYGIRPPYGLLIYRNRTFRIDFTDELEQEIMEVLDWIRQQKEQEEVSRSHEQKNRCERCGFRRVCDQRL